MLRQTIPDIVGYFKEKYAKKRSWLLLLTSLISLPAQAAILPGPPTLTVPEYDEGTYTVSWSQRYDFVRLEEKASNSSTWAGKYSGSTETSMQFTKSSNGAWDYRVHACRNREGSIPERCTLWNQKTVTVQLPPSAPGSLGPDRVEQGSSYTLSWGASSGIVTKYAVQSRAGRSYATVAEVTGTSHTISGNTDDLYRYRIMPCNLAGCQTTGLPYVDIYVRKTPNVPQSPQIAASDYVPGNAILTWAAPTDNGTINSYEISDKLEGDYPWLPYATVDGNATNLNIVAHTAGSYRFRVRACKNNPLGDSVCGNWSSQVSLAFVYPPQITWVETPANSNDGSVSMSWYRTQGDVTSYHVTRLRKLDDTSAWGEEATFDRGLEQAFTDSLRRDGEYRYRVAGCNSAGCGYTTEDEMVVDITVDALVDDVTPIDLGVPTSEYVGSLSESASIDGGNVSYSVDMPVPPGRNGMQPKIGLSYSSGGGNGVVGAGWSLNAGNGAVYRCPNIAAAGGENRPYLGLEDDRLCLNGQHLMLVDGNYGQANSTYHTEITDYAVVKLLNGSSNTASSYFEVTHKSGNISRYQYTWVPQSQGFPTHWYLTQEEDLNGNQIDYVYSQGVEPLLQNINYTGFNGQQGNRRVQFVYEDRPQLQQHYGYKPQGGRDYATQRLIGIETYLDSTLVHSMIPAYETSALTGRSLLKELQICDVNGNCLPKSVYSYNDQERDFVLDTLVEEDWSKIYFVGDHDGDGKSDSIKEVIEWNYGSSGYYSEIHRYLRLSSRPGTQFSESEVGFTLPNKNSFDTWSDMLLDGKQDFLAAGSDLKMKVISIDYVSAGSSAQVETTTFNTNLALPSQIAVFQVADFNADGRPDVLVHSGSVRTVHLNCTNYSINVSALQFCGQITLADPRESGTATHYNLAEITDFNLDGLPDLLFSGWSENQPGVFHDHLIAYAQKNGDSFSFSELQTSPYQVASTTTVLGLDANGDGLLDRLLLRQGANPLLQINDGTGSYITADVSGDFGLEEQHLRHGLLSFDYNGDGRDELLVPENLVADFYYHETIPDGGNDSGETTITYSNEGVGEAFRSNDGHSFKYNRAVYNYRKLSFDWSDHTSVTLTSEATELDLPLGQSKVCDANGDGLTDICYDIQNIPGINHDSSVDFDKGSYHHAVVRGSHVWINSRAAHSFGDDALAYTKNGLGLERFWRYSPLSGVGSSICAYDENTPFYTVDRNINAPGHYHFGSTMPVVSSYSESNGVGGNNRQCYRYEDAMYSSMGRGFQGFKAISVDAQVAGDDYSTITRTEYHDQFPLTGRVKQAEVRLSTDSADSAPLSRSTNLWNWYWQYDADAGIHQVLHDMKKQETFDLESRDLLGKTIVISRYNIGEDRQYGNVSRTETTKESYLNGDLAVRDSADIDYRYDYGDASGGWFNKLEQETITTQPTEYFGNLAAILPNGSANNSKLVTTDYLYYATTRRLQRQTLQQGIANEQRFKELGYDDYGNIDSVTLGAPGQTSRTSTIDYSSDGYFPYEQYNALGHKTRTEYDARFGVIDEQLSANSVRSYFRYNDMGALHKVEADGRQPINTSTQYCDGDCPALAVSRKITVQNGSPIVTEYLDMLGRVIKTETHAFENNPAVITSAEYDAHGWKLAESQPSHNAGGVDFVRYADFDQLGRYRSKTVDRSGHAFSQQQWSYDYNGLSTTITLPDGSSTATRVIDANGLLLSTTDAIGSSTHYRYDSLGNKVLTQDHFGNQVRYYFDNLGRKVKVEDPDAGTTAMPAALNQYNGFGEVVTTTNANGDVLVFDHDRLGRITQRSVNGTLEAIWTYDDGKLGTLSRVDMPQLSYYQSIAYDDLVRPTGLEIAFTPNDSTGHQRFTTTTAYDANHGRVKARYFSSGEFVEYRYDMYGNLIEERDPLSDTLYYHVDSVNARGQVLGASYGNDLELDQAYYNSTGDVESIRVNGAQGALLDLYYRFDDPFGNLTSRENRVAGAVESFYYDDIQRLTQSSVSWSGAIDPRTVGYDYDAIGNMLLKSDFADVYHYGSADRSQGNAGPHAVHRVERQDGTAIEYQYDNAGNMTTGNGRSTSYNAYNKPLQVQENGGTTIFTYGPSLELIKREDAERTIYYGGGMQRVIDGNNVIERTPLSANVLVEDGPEGRKVRYQHYDRLGSLVLVTDETGQVTESHGFDAFGKALEGDWQDTGGLLHSGANGEELTEKGYTGHEHLDKHKLVHMGGRIYDPLLGRFMSVDPYIQSETSTQSQNAYSYVMNNPLSMIDPSGYHACSAKQAGEICRLGSTSYMNSDYLGSSGQQAPAPRNGQQATNSQPASGREVRIHSEQQVYAPNGQESGASESSEAISYDENGMEHLEITISGTAPVGASLDYRSQMVNELQRVRAARAKRMKQIQYDWSTRRYRQFRGDLVAQVPRATAEFAALSVVTAAAAVALPTAAAEVVATARFLHPGLSSLTTKQVGTAIGIGKTIHETGNEENPVKVVSNMVGLIPLPDAIDFPIKNALKAGAELYEHFFPVE